jgi:hypothetical protein
MFYNELIRKMNDLTGKELKELQVDSENYDKLFSWLKT